jgi:murein DD-endopeptidase MepM/ murein hydrolase activator NlpD
MKPNPTGVTYSLKVGYPCKAVASPHDGTGFFLREICPFLGHADNGTYRRGYGWHTGIDIILLGRADRGLGIPVVAIADGVVVDSSPTLSPFGYGNMILIYHPQFNKWSRYGHLQKRVVAKGEVVRAGQTIGTMGKTGSDNVHLHWDVIKEQLPIARYNPKNHGKPASKEAERLLVVKYFQNPSKWVAAMRDA